jgi:uncharacterized membrane-anchored protein YjiN (DUF445 family)
VNVDAAASGQPHEGARVQALARMKWIALAALAAAVVGLVVSVAMGAQGAWAWLQAFCEAAAIGALADWFAVVALFRHPLGIPIPHTALLPRSKDRLADSLATFVRDQFMAPDTLLAKLAVFNPAARLGDWLRTPDNADQLTRSVRTLALEGLSFLNEASIRQAINEFVVNKAKDWDASVTAAQVMGLLTQDGRHHQLLDAALERVAEYLNEEGTRQLIASKMVAAVRREYPKLVGIVDTFSSVDSLGGSLADKVSRQLVEEVHQALAQPEHSIRIRYEQFIDGFLERLRHDGPFRSQVNQIKNQLSESQQVRSYLDGLWEALQVAIATDLQRDDSALLQHLRQGLDALGHKLATDPGLVEVLNAHLLSAASKLVAQLRSGVTEHIASTVKAWDDRELVRQLELSVGRDLQFIRLNGTLVGGLIGLALHGALMWVKV